MNNSPFEVFRRNLKPLMVFLTALALFAFVVLPVLDSSMRQNAETGAEQVLARFDGQKLTRSRVEAFTRNHRDTLEFLRDLANRTIKQGKYPRTAGFDVGSEGNIQSVGINPSPSNEGTIRTFVFAGQAMKEGFALSDSQLSVWLDQFCDESLSESQLNGLMMKISGARMGLPQLKDQLRLHMLAQVFVNRGYAGLQIMTPEQEWSSFLKLNQNATAETYAVLVSDYFSKTNENPSEPLIIETYEEGKDRFPNDQSSDPAFRKGYEAKFQYLTGSPEAFLKDEISKLTEDELRTEHQRILAETLTLPDAPSFPGFPALPGIPDLPAEETKPAPAEETKPAPAEETKPAPAEETKPAPAEETKPAPAEE
ncbi:MAG: hypothetical protein OSA98_22185, partial [Rubripirellula sp.]|nr:hypothetical protein [Rubripirellula sp.]